MGDNNCMASAAAKEAKKLKTEGGMVENTAKEDEKAAAKSDNLSKRRLSLGEHPESDNGHTAPQELCSIEDESISRIPKAENGNENKLNLNEKNLEVLESNPVFTGKDDEVKFSHTKIIMRRGPLFFYSTTRDRHKNGTRIDFEKLEIHPISRTHIYPVPTSAPNPLPPDMFLKRPNLIYYADSKCLTEISALFMHEAQRCEMIKRSPHPNVVKYFGCLIDQDGRISELCFARYRKTLSQMVKDGETFDRKACLDDIRAGIEHIHSLGIIHCDINLHNVFADVYGFVIGDFDSCALEGDELGAKAGTHGWTSDDFALAQRENDWFGFAKIEQFLFPPKEH